MGKGIGRWAALWAAVAMAAVGCGGGGSDGAEIGAARVNTAEAVLAARDAHPADGPGVDAVGDLHPSLGDGSTSSSLAPLKLGETAALRPLASSSFSRENTYHVYAANGMRKLLRLDFVNKRYEMLDDTDRVHNGHSTSGSLSEDPAEPGTYILGTDRSVPNDITSRLRVSQGAVVGGFAFEMPEFSETFYAWAPFVGANDFIVDPAQLDGDYTRMGFTRQLPNGSSFTSLAALRITGGGRTVEACAQGAVQWAQCTDVRRYTLSAAAVDGTWTATGSGPYNAFEFRVARIGSQKVWLEGGLTSGPLPSPYRASLLIGLASSPNWPSTRYAAVSTESLWSLHDVGQAAMRSLVRQRQGGYQAFPSVAIEPEKPVAASGLRSTNGAWLIQNGVMLVSVPSGIDFGGWIDIGLARGPLSAEPASPLNGTYRVFTTNGQEHTLSINFDAGTYVMTDASGLAASGSFQADPADPGTYVFASSRVSVVYNTARFRVATDGIVGAFPFATYGSNPVSYKTMPFTAARSFVTNRTELAGVYDILATGGVWSMRLNAEGTAAIRQCGNADCTGSFSEVWSVAAGAVSGQWIFNPGGQTFNAYIAKFGTRRVLLSSFETAMPTVPLSLGPYILLGFRQPPVGYSNAAWPTYALHTTSGTTFGKATLTHSAYSEAYLDEAGQSTNWSLTLDPPTSYLPSMRSGSIGGTLSATLTHNGELFWMFAVGRGYAMGLVDR
ncbi:MAG: hypothetical protein JSR41_05655 [Proteobacteria bacterium]|nr:hypothetical protein [Pseudomonadota bacterium]